MKTYTTLTLGAYAANCYLLWNDRHVLIVDPGSKSPKIKEAIEAKDGIVDGIFLTHGHFDHIAGVDALVKQYACGVYINELDKAMLRDPNLNFSMPGHDVIIESEVISLQPGQQKIGAFEFTLIDAPGHSEGSCLMLWDHYMICGDVIFEGSVGRTDLPGGSNSKMFQSLHMIKTLNPEYEILPGHGSTTTLQRELQSNPYLL